MKTEPKSEPMSTPNELQRWMPYSSCAGQRGYMEKEDAGQWVRFSDIEPLIRSHEALRGLLRVIEADYGHQWELEDEGTAAHRKGIHTRITAALAAAKEVSQ